MTAPLPADQSGEEDSFLRSRVERFDLRNLTWARADRRGEAVIGEFVEPLFRSCQFWCVIRVEIMPAIAATVHNDLICHDRPPRIAGDQGPRTCEYPTDVTEYQEFVASDRTVIRVKAAQRLDRPKRRSAGGGDANGDEGSVGMTVQDSAEVLISDQFWQLTQPEVDLIALLATLAR